MKYITDCFVQKEFVKCILQKGKIMLQGQSYLLSFKTNTRGLSILFPKANNVKCCLWKQANSPASLDHWPKRMCFGCFQQKKKHQPSCTFNNYIVNPIFFSVELQSTEKKYEE